MSGLGGRTGAATGSLDVSWPAAATRFLALRFLPGDDLRQGLRAAFAAVPERAGFVAACVGSLGPAVIRTAGRDEGLVVPGPLEIVSLSGTFSIDGPHLHVAVADAEGAMTGGHLMEGSVVRTTVEVVLGLAAGVVFARPHDPRTGYGELTMWREK